MTQQKEERIHGLAEAVRLADFLNDSGLTVETVKLANAYDIANGAPVLPEYALEVRSMAIDSLYTVHNWKEGRRLVWLTEQCAHTHLELEVDNNTQPPSMYTPVVARCYLCGIRLELGDRYGGLQNELNNAFRYIRQALREQQLHTAPEEKEG